MKNARAEFVNVGDRIDELADEVAGVPFKAEVLVFAGVEEAFPHGGLPKHIVMHERQMVGALRTMLEGNANTAIGGEGGQWLPESDEFRDELFEGLINRVAAVWVYGHFNVRTRKAGHGFHADMSGHFNGAMEYFARAFRLRWMQRVSVESADGGDTDVASFGFRSEIFGGRFPVGVLDANGAFFKAYPFDGTKAKAVGPIQFVWFTAY
jgi:hypothetical protein